MNLQYAARQFAAALSSIRLIPHMVWLSLSKSKSCIILDIEAWSVETFYEKPKDLFHTLWNFVQLMTFLPEYRNLLYYRLGWMSKILYPICRPMPLLEIKRVEEGIGPGFIIKHGRATGIAARRIGKNCKVMQHVSIGYTNPRDKPILGDNVIVFAGAKVYGNITIGNNVIIGANAVVVKSVPDNCTVVGVPAYIIKRDGKKVREAL